MANHKIADEELLADGRLCFVGVALRYVLNHIFNRTSSLGNPTGFGYVLWMRPGTVVPRHPARNSVEPAGIGMGYIVVGYWRAEKYWH